MTEFIITIDTEGDDLWTNPAQVTTTNALYLPRFQQLCEEYGFKPTYLVNYEMACDPYMQAFGRSILNNDTGEIGLHLHAWNSPPIEPNCRDQIYQFELPEEVLYSKLHTLHTLLSDVFGIAPVSHRAGRWGFNERVAKVLVQLGYLADCSVTPGISWARTKGDSQGHGGMNFRDFPLTPYFMDLNDVKSEGTSPLLEIPVTIRTLFSPPLLDLHYLVERTLADKALKLFFGRPYLWLRPNGRNLDRQLRLVDWGIRENLPVLQFSFHSSELMPKGSPSFRTEESIERLYVDLAQLFKYITSRGIRGVTMHEYRLSLEPDGVLR